MLQKKVQLAFRQQVVSRTSLRSVVKRLPDQKLLRSCQISSTKGDNSICKSKEHERQRLAYAQSLITLTEHLRVQRLCHHVLQIIFKDDQSWLLRVSIYVSLQTFRGNYDRNGIQTHSFDPPIYGRFVRLNPRGWKSHISMRLELYGCPWSKHFGVLFFIVYSWIFFFLFILSLSFAKSLFRITVQVIVSLLEGSCVFHLLQTTGLLSVRVLVPPLF